MPGTVLDIYVHLPFNPPSTTATHGKLNILKVGFSKSYSQELKLDFGMRVKIKTKTKQYNSIKL